MMTRQEERLAEEQHPATTDVEYAAVRIMAGSVVPEDTLANVLKLLCDSYKFDFGAVWTMDDAANVLRCVNSSHSSDLGIAHAMMLGKEIRRTETATLPCASGKAAKRLAQPTCEMNRIPSESMSPKRLIS